jgi:hypothetical protein
MADAAVVHISENSPEHVAFKLLLAVTAAEKMNMHPYVGGNDYPVNRAWILDTYAECLLSVQRPENRK